MKKIIVTPAGRKPYLEILAAHLYKRRGQFDEWHIWQNTQNEEDLEFLQHLDAKIISPTNSNPSLGTQNISSFYPIDSVDPNALYLRLDDDIVWMEPNFINKMFSYRANNTKNFLIFANIINNSVCSHLHMRYGYISWNDLLGYNCFDPVGWSSPIFAHNLHNTFLSNFQNYNKFYFNDWYLYLTERVSVNAISWRGEDMLLCGGDVTINPPNSIQDEEEWLCKYGPSVSGNKRNVIYGQALCVHYAYKTQRDHLEKTDFLYRYHKLV